MLLWGSLFPMVKLGFQAYEITSTGDILLFAGVRFTICGVIICAFALGKNRKNFIPVKSSVLPVLLSGLFAIVLHYAFMYIGLAYTDSSKTAILKQVGVLFYVCFSALFFKNDRLTVGKLIGVLLGFSGIVATSISSDGFSFHIGDLFIIAASFCMVFSNIIGKKVFQKVEPITATGCSQLFGGVVLLAIGLAMGGKMYFALDRSAWIMVYICLASVFGYCIWYSIVKSNELSRLFIIKFAEPMFASIIGALVLGENIFKIQYIIAFLLIALGIYIANYKSKKAKGTDREIKGGHEETKGMQPEK